MTTSSSRGRAAVRSISGLIRGCLAITIILEVTAILGAVCAKPPRLCAAVGTPEEEATVAPCPPAFEAYSVDEVFRGKPAPVDLKSHPQARVVRTRLREGAAKGPNFAGHYTVVTWACGTNCQVLAIVDARNGRVFFPGVVSETGVAYRIDSALLVENPGLADRPPDDPERNLFGGPNYYRWDGSRLAPVADAGPATAAR